jgi:HEAT repeat protein
LNIMTDLLQMLETGRPVERWWAAEALTARANDEHAVMALAKALGDAHPFVRWQAGRTLARSALGRQRLLHILARDDSLPLVLQSAADAVSRSGLKPELVAPVLQAALDNADPRVRQEAAEALAFQGDGRSVARLSQLLNDEDVWVRRAAAKALGHLGDVRVVPALVQCLSDASPLIRRSAAYALGALRAADAVPQLIEALNDADPLVRRNGAWALGRIGSPAVAALPALRRLRIELAPDGNLAATVRQAERAIARLAWLKFVPGFRIWDQAGPGRRKIFGAALEPFRRLRTRQER